jgi:hypothetical protein
VLCGACGLSPALGLVHRRHEASCTKIYFSRSSPLEDGRRSAATPEETKQLSFGFAHLCIVQVMPETMEHVMCSRRGARPRRCCEAEFRAVVSCYKSWGPKRTFSVPARISSSESRLVEGSAVPYLFKVAHCAIAVSKCSREHMFVNQPCRARDIIQCYDDDDCNIYISARIDRAIATRSLCTFAMIQIQAIVVHCVD